MAYSWGLETGDGPPAPDSLLHRVDHLLQLAGHVRNRHARHVHPSVATLAHDDVHPAPRRVLVGMVFAEVAAAALLALDRRACDRLRYGQQVVEIKRRVPRRVVLAVAADTDAPRAIPQRRDRLEGVLH